MSQAKSVLVIGGSGFVGTQIALKLKDEYKVTMTFHSRKVVIPGVTAVPIKLEKEDSIKRILRMSRPDVIVYVAGQNSPEWADAHPKESDHLHGGAPIKVLNHAGLMGSRFVYVSNCYVFDGLRGNYHENENVIPGNSLGKSKVNGENLIRGKSLNYVIVRSSPIYGFGNGVNLSFLDHLRMKLSVGQSVELSDHEMHSFCPMSTFLELIQRVTNPSGPRNRIFHCAGGTKLTYFEFGKAFAKRFGFDESLIHARRDLPTPRGGSLADFSLNSSQVIETLKIKPLLLEEGLDLFDQLMVSGA